MSRPRAALRNVMSRKVTFGGSRGWSGCGETSGLLHPAERRRSALSSARPKRRWEMVRMKAVMIAENRAASDGGGNVRELSSSTQKGKRSVSSFREARMARMIMIRNSISTARDDAQAQLKTGGKYGSRQ